MDRIIPYSYPEGDYYELVFAYTNELDGKKKFDVHMFNEKQAQIYKERLLKECSSISEIEINPSWGDNSRIGEFEVIALSFNTFLDMFFNETLYIVLKITDIGYLAEDRTGTYLEKYQIWVTNYLVNAQKVNGKYFEPHSYADDKEVAFLNTSIPRNKKLRDMVELKYIKRKYTNFD